MKKAVLGGALRAIGHRLVVTEVEQLSANLRRVRFAGEALRRLPFHPGDKVKLLVGDGVLRSYTPFRVDPVRGEMDVTFYLHGEAPAANWARTVKRGADSAFVGPKASMPGKLDTPPFWAMFLGDETTLGLAHALLSQLPKGTALFGAIELAAEDASAVRALDLPLTPVIRRPLHGEALLHWLKRATLPLAEGVIWLSGDAGSTLMLSRALQERGYPRAQLRIKPYWSVKGSAHRKQLEAGALKA